MALSVKFYQKPHYMEFLSDKEGRPIHEMRDFVRIEIPGITANVVDTFVTEAHKQEHSKEWHQFLNQKASGVFTEHQGTLLSDWPQLNAIQVLELQHVKFHTVEQIAEASDLQISAIGMVAGMSPLSLRDKARAWLAKAQGADQAKAQADELAKRDAQIAELRAMVEQLAADKPKVGRPKKETADA